MSDLIDGLVTRLGSNSGLADGTEDASTPASPLHAEPSALVDTSTQAFRLIARLGSIQSALAGAAVKWPIQACRCRARDNSSGSPVPDEPQKYAGDGVGDPLIRMEYVHSSVSFLLIPIFDRVFSSCFPVSSILCHRCVFHCAWLTSFLLPYSLRHVVVKYRLCITHMLHTSPATGRTQIQ